MEATLFRAVEDYLKIDNEVVCAVSLFQDSVYDEYLLNYGFSRLKTTLKFLDAEL